MGKFARTWRLILASWSVLRSERNLLVFPVFSGIASALVIASFWVPLFNPHTLDALKTHTGHDVSGAYTLLFLFYFCSYLVTIFFNSALIACALEKMDGGEPSIGFGLRAAWERFPQIFGWAALASTVGLVLRMIEQRVGFVGRFIAGLLGMAWTVTAFLVIPVLINEKKGPIEAYRKSMHLLRESWGEQIIATVGFGLVFGLLGLLPAFIIGAALISAFPRATLLILALGVMYFVALMLVQTTLHSIYQAAVYRYAADGKPPAGFKDEYLADAFRGY